MKPSDQVPSQNKRRKFARLKGYNIINDNIVDLIKAVKDGPVIVAHFVSSSFKFYSSGVFDGDGCEGANTVNHSSLLVGYDLQADVPYLLLKNSWGENWGEGGFFKLGIGPLLETSKGLCLVAGSPFNVIPVLN